MAVWSRVLVWCLVEFGLDTVWSPSVWSQGSSETKLMSDSDDEPCMLLQDLDTLMRIKYPQTHPKSHGTHSPRPMDAVEEPMDDDEYNDNGEFITVSLDYDGIPLYTNNTFAKLSDETEGIQPITIDEQPLKFESAKQHKKPLTQITVTWNELPHDMRTKFAPLMKMKKKGGYVNVNPQPGMGGGFQVQAWSAATRKHIRLGTVKCERVGAIMLAASELDTSLSSEKLVCRDWFIRMVSDEVYRSEWLAQY
jgi:hypothetical protein